MVIPVEFGIEFLNWFKQRTESYWATHSARSFDYYVQSGTGGTDWQLGTKWLSGLSDEQIQKIEEEWSIIFPPDYRLFLQHLHCVDRPMIGAAFDADDGQRLTPITMQAFCNWVTGRDNLQKKFLSIIEGFEFDIEHNNIWFSSWGEKPDSLVLQKRRLQEVLRSAPKLIPIFLHRFLLAEPAISGNPVLSVYQTDVIMYGRDLRSYLLREFESILGIASTDVPQNIATNASWSAIPFWGELLLTN